MATTFHFKAVTSEGKVRMGSIAAETDRLVARELTRQGLTPVYIGLQEQKGGIEFKLPDLTGRKRRSVLFFTQELSTLLNSGIPVDRALSITLELAESGDFRAVVQDVLRVLKGGKSLADSLATHPNYFGDLYVNMVRAGEASGSLSTVFQRLAEFENTRDDLRNYIIGSMIYPALLATVGIASVIVMMYYVVPRFAAAFEASQLQVPVPTQIMLNVSNFVRSYGWIAAVTLILGFAGFRSYIGTPEGRMWWDRIRLKLPLLGYALLKAETARFARAMSTLVANSVPLVQSLGIARGILNNQIVAGTLDGIAQGVKRGEGIAAPLKRSGVFPPLAGHLLSVGEETGRLDAMFARMAEIYENDTRTAIKRFTSVFEPMVILIMGIVVGSLILSMMLAITSVNEVNL
jgi:general secretion pathway protein F